MNIKQSAWTGMVPVDDTALYVSKDFRTVAQALHETPAR